jgi:ribosome-associated heat shock protein Hsp15
MPGREDETTPVRLDKWLWAARFFKTRSLAAEAVDGGKVHLNGARVKRGKPVQLGDQIRLRRGPYEFRVTVRRLSERRGSATQAGTMYEEAADSVRAREHLQQQHQVAKAGFTPPKGRPTKRDRRKIERLKYGDDRS